MFKKIALSLCFTLFLGLLSACSPSETLRLNKAQPQTESPNQTSSENGEKAGNTSSASTNSGIGAPIALPPSFGETPSTAPRNTTEFMPNGLPALKPMKGINVETLFAENIKNTDQRFDRVEGVVKDLREEFEAYKPSIVRLTAVEADIQNLIKELEVLLQETPSQQLAPSVDQQTPDPSLQVEQLDPQPLLPDSFNDETEEPAPVEIAANNDTKSQSAGEIKKPPAQTKPKPKKQKPPALPSYDGIVAKNLRVGEHADKVRLVLDTNKTTKFSIDLDNAERLIVVELPEARWIGDIQKSFPHSKILESYTVEEINDGKGSMIVIALRKDTSILREKRLSPDSDNPYHRIYFDLKP